MVITQDYQHYTAEQHAVWSVLYKRQLAAVERFAATTFLEGLRQLGFNAAAIPDFALLNKRLQPLTGWQVYAVPGLIDNKFFFEQLFERRFGATVWIRNREQLDYLEEPDMFHDVFGHVPLLTSAAICAYLQGLAGIASVHIDNPVIIEAIARLYWYTIEFGLIEQQGELKIYGSGILSSIGETAFAMSPESKKVPFDIETILDTPYIKDKFQEKYFVIESMDTLANAIPLLSAYFNRMPAAEGMNGGPAK
jgi:phenylalanine-4-hydroxylase